MAAMLTFTAGVVFLRTVLTLALLVGQLIRPNHPKTQTPDPPL
jgi:hypothetical protein